MTQKERKNLINRVMRWHIQETGSSMLCTGMLAFDLINALSGEHSPVPDPETGLVPCGCGKPLSLLNFPGEYSERHHARNPKTNILDEPSTWDTPPSWWVECARCPVSIGSYHSDTHDCIVGVFESPEEAIKAANTAMGYKEDA